MSDFAQFLIIFSIILGTALLAVCFLTRPWKRIRHEYTWLYNTSTDYERLWELISSGICVIGIDPDFEDGGKLRRYWPYDIKLLEHYDGKVEVTLKGLDTLKNPTKEKFIGYCEYKGIRFLDMTDLVDITTKEEKVREL